MNNWVMLGLAVVVIAVQAAVLILFHRRLKRIKEELYRE